MKKKRFATVIMVLAVIVGLGLILYPTVSDYVNSLGYRQTIAEYNRSVQELDTETYEQLLNAAYEYNARLSGRTMSPLSLSDEERAVYETMLDISGTGVMGYIEIPKANISLPIYHGTGEAVLQSGVGHLEGSSLPVGGENTHTILSGHRGLPSSKLFTNIDRLKEGDTFTVRVLNEILTYEVDQIQTVEPYVLDLLRIEEGQDYCTLVTCTPYGVNTHRLMVRGHRIETPEEAYRQGNNGGLTFSFLNKAFDPLMLVPAAIAIAAVIGIVILAIHYRTRKRKPDKAEPEKQEESAEPPDSTDSPGSDEPKE